MTNTTKQIHKNKWFRNTTDELRLYRVLKKRIEIIEMLLRKQCGPDEKAIANYGINTFGGQNPDEINKLEVELKERQRKLQVIEKSFEVLSGTGLKIIELKFKTGYQDKRIYEIELPMSTKTFYEYYNESITEIAKCLGFLEM